MSKFNWRFLLKKALAGLIFFLSHSFCWHIKFNSNFKTLLSYLFIFKSGFIFTSCMTGLRDFQTWLFSKSCSHFRIWFNLFKLISCKSYLGMVYTYTKSLVNTNSFYTTFTDTNFQTGPILWNRNSFTYTHFSSHCIN